MWRHKKNQWILLERLPKKSIISFNHMYKYSGLQKSLRNTLFISCILYGTDGTPFSFTQHKCVTQIICSREMVGQESSILLILIALTCDTIIHVSKKKIHVSTSLSTWSLSTCMRVASVAWSLISVCVFWSSLFQSP